MVVVLRFFFSFLVHLVSRPLLFLPLIRANSVEVFYCLLGSLWPTYWHLYQRPEGPRFRQLSEESAVNTPRCLFHWYLKEIYKRASRILKCLPSDREFRKGRRIRSRHRLEWKRGLEPWFARWSNLSAERLLIYLAYQTSSVLLIINGLECLICVAGTVQLSQNRSTDVFDIKRLLISEIAMKVGGSITSALIRNYFINGRRPLKRLVFT